LIKNSLLVIVSSDVIMCRKYISTEAVSCYPVLIVHLIWFANEQCLSCQH